MVWQTCMQCPGFSKNVQDGFAPHLQVLRFVPGTANDAQSAPLGVIGAA